MPPCLPVSDAESPMIRQDVSWASVSTWSPSMVSHRLSNALRHPPEIQLNKVEGIFFLRLSELSTLDTSRIPSSRILHDQAIGAIAINFVREHVYYFLEGLTFTVYCREQIAARRYCRVCSALCALVDSYQSHRSPGSGAFPSFPFCHVNLDLCQVCCRSHDSEASTGNTL